MNARDLFFAYIDAYNAKDVDRMLSIFDENCIFENVSQGKATVSTRGKQELLTLAKETALAFAAREQKVTSITAVDDRLVAEINYHGILAEDLAPDMKAGTELNLRGVSVVEFKAGKIMRLSDYS